MKSIINSNIKKRNAAEEGIKYIKEGMTVGLGSGSTVNEMLEILGEKVRSGLNVKGIPTSKKTEILANKLRIPLIKFSSDIEIDVAIDGTDEVDANYNLLKGGGGSLVREKLVGMAANKMIIIADESKVVSTLGAFSLPVEILPFGWEVTKSRIAKLGCKPTLRKNEGEVFISDNGNFIVDCKFNEILHPEVTHEKLKLMVGVVETGLFINMCDLVIVGYQEHIEYLK